MRAHLWYDTCLSIQCCVDAFRREKLNVFRVLPEAKADISLLPHSLKMAKTFTLKLPHRTERGAETKLGNTGHSS